MHKHSKDSCIDLNKTWVNDSGFAFVGKVGHWPFWTLVQVLLYSDAVHVPVSSFSSSFWYERIAAVGKIYTRMHMQYLIADFVLINYKITHDNHEAHGCPYSHR
jgi:hypothetical protein